MEDFPIVVSWVNDLNVKLIIIMHNSTSGADDILHTSKQTPYEVMDVLLGYVIPNHNDPLQEVS